jgi:hypothetical protein
VQGGYNRLEAPQTEEPRAMSDERRRAKRQRVEYLATMVTSRGSPSHYCLVTELSEGGVRIKAIGYSVPDEFGLRLSGHAVPKHYRMIWRIGHDIGATLIDQAQPAPDQMTTATPAL